MRGSVWDETVFTKNRDRLIEGDIARKFMAAVLSQGSVEALLSDDHGGLHARGPPSISDARAAPRYIGRGYRALEVVKELLLTGPARTGSQQRDDRRNQPSGVNQRWSLTLPTNASTSFEIASVLIWWPRDYTPHL
jgi:hypothetical protein